MGNKCFINPPKDALRYAAYHMLGHIICWAVLYAGPYHMQGHIICWAISYAEPYHMQDHISYALPVFSTVSKLVIPLAQSASRRLGAVGPRT